MKYIIDMIDDIRENIQNSQNYTLLAMLLKEDKQKNLQNKMIHFLFKIVFQHSLSNERMQQILLQRR